ncbi:hypothetical protein [Halodesulfovibrio aestuarii]|uniref:DUF975 family protein n=1 Tax=Halodesulfovibrio aestuarii TaxID=126333 RepID=A0ABV4JMW7_9BACT
MKPFGKFILFTLIVISIGSAALLANTMDKVSYSRLLSGVTTFSIGILAVAGAWFAVMIPEYIRLARTIKSKQSSKEERERFDIDANIEELKVIRALQKNILLPIALSSFTLVTTMLLTLGLELFPHIKLISWMTNGDINFIFISKFIAIACLLLMYVALGVMVIALLYSPVSLSHRLERIYNIEKIFTRHPK